MSLQAYAYSEYAQIAGTLSRLRNPPVSLRYCDTNVWIAVFVYSISECSWSITATAKLSFSSGLWSVSQMVKTLPFHGRIGGFNSPTDHHHALYTWNYDRRNTFSQVD